MAERRESNISALRVKIDVDCTEALKGLKAITREAKKATAALKQLEEQQSKLVTSKDITVNINASSIHNPNAKELLNKIIKDIDRSKKEYRSL